MTSQGRWWGRQQSCLASWERVVLEKLGTRQFSPFYWAQELSVQWTTERTQVRWQHPSDQQWEGHQSQNLPTGEQISESIWAPNSYCTQWDFHTYGLIKHLIPARKTPESGTLCQAMAVGASCSQPESLATSCRLLGHPVQPHGKQKGKVRPELEAAMEVSRQLS